MDKLLEEIRAKAGDIEERHFKIHPIIGVISEIGSVTISYGIDFREVLIRTSRLSSLAISLVDTPRSKLEFVPLLRLASFRDQLSSVSEAFNNVTAQSVTVRDNGGVARIEPSSGVVFTTNGNQFNMRSPVEELSNRVDQAMESYLILAGVSHPRGIGTFAAASRVLDSKAHDATKLVGQMEDHLVEIVARSNQATSLTESQKALLVESERLQLEIEKSRRTSTENKSAIETAAAQVASIQATAKTLEQTISDYQSKFDSFQTGLDARNLDIQEGQKRLSDLNTYLNDKSDEIDEAIAKSNEMLGGSTIAGLSHAYHQQVTSLNKSLRFTEFTFYGSIVFLLVSAAAALNLFPGMPHLPPLPPFTDSTPTGSIAVQVLSALGSRALIILPALLLAAFTTKRHSSLFRLKHEYTHKYTTAASVHGFKQQAPTYQEQIAAAVFQELLINPSSSLGSETEASENPNGFIAKLLAPHVRSALEHMEKIQVK
jgi:hypothetical protein